MKGDSAQVKRCGYLEFRKVSEGIVAVAWLVCCGWSHRDLRRDRLGSMH
jgi:hypothetical protein